ncbi:MAG: autotransporter outer membrane beta-barrel domain-containing protein [Alphaproteobacteria bacterium]|nr:autotransporter outer membrane beta-barrel domain-containing protein [Alphaproteobacteria bacterium]
MSSPRSRRGLMGIVFACLIPLSVQPAFAFPANCNERGASYRSISKTTGVLTLKVSKNDLINWKPLAKKTRVKIDFGDGFKRVKSTGSYTVPKKQKKLRIKVSNKKGQLAVSCTTQKDDNYANFSWNIAANSQTQATGAGIGANSRGRFGLGGNIVSQDYVFVSTSNLAKNRFGQANWSAWASVEGRSYSGGLDGVSVDFVGGFDRLVAPDLLLGMLGGYGRTIVSDSGTPEVTSSPMLGVYIGKNVDNKLIIDGFISVAQPRYDISGTSFNASRLSAGLTFTGQIQRPGLLIEPFLFARGYRELQPSYTAGLAVIPANKALSMSASLGVKVSFTRGLGAGNFVPYASASADFQRQSSTLTADDVLAAPRIAMGLSGTIGQGTLNVDMDFGKTRSDTYDRGFKIGYELNF